MKETLPVNTFYAAFSDYLTHIPRSGIIVHGLFSEKSDKIKIVGDLNADFLNIQNTHVIRDIFSNNALVNLISDPTRNTNTTRTPCIKQRRLY